MVPSQNTGVDSNLCKDIAGTHPSSVIVHATFGATCLVGVHIYVRCAYHQLHLQLVLAMQT